MINITKVSAVCNLGKDINEIFKNAIDGVKKTHHIDFELPKIDDKKYNLRCNQILLHLYNQLEEDIKLLKEKYNKNRIGIIIGTTNSGIDEFEETNNEEHLKISNPAEFLKELAGVEGYTIGISTACTSGIKTFSAARTIIENGICDAVITGGVDPIAKLPCSGFKALEVLTDTLTNPFSKNRTGMNIGEGGALFILEKESNGIKILGIGETSDAYNAATPDPEATQAINAMRLALNDANLIKEDIDYINLHGTGTIANDIMEARAVYEVFNDSTYSSSTKPLTGHCLGASASIETALCIKVLETGILLPHIYDGEYDETLPKIKLVEKTNQKLDNIETCMCNAFGFGGTNAVLVIGK